MSNTQQEENYNKEEWGAWKIVSDMLDKPDENGIYQTSECYQKLYEFVVSQKEQAIQAERERIIKEINGSQLAEVVRFFESNRGSGHTYAEVKGVENVNGAFLIVADEHQKQNTGLAGDKQLSLSSREIILGGRRCAIVVDHFALQKMFHDIINLLQTNNK
jgi:hypothetical protein